MTTRGFTETVLVDDDVLYATGNDVFTHVRNKRYVDLDETIDDTEDIGRSATSLTQTQVVDLIARFSDRVDNTTKRAWRTRKVEAYEVPVKFSHQDKRGRHRRRRRRGNIGAMNRVHPHGGGRGLAKLPHNHVQDVETVEVLNPRSVDDVTDDEGRGDGSWVLDERKGIIRPDVTLFIPTGRSGAANRVDIESAHIRTTYTYGREPVAESADDLTDDYQIATTVPGDIRDAVALLVAARLVGSDQYGELTPNTSGDSPGLAEAVSSWRSEAKDTLREYTRP